MLVVSDCDLTIWCGCLYRYDCDDPNHKVIDELDELLALGYDLILWSGGGADHAQAVAQKLQLAPIKCLDKVSHPITDEKVIAHLGRMPDIQYDDAENERIPGVKDFRLVEDYNPHGLTLMRGLWIPDE